MCPSLSNSQEIPRYSNKLLITNCAFNKFFHLPSPLHLHHSKSWIYLCLYILSTDKGG